MPGAGGAVSRSAKSGHRGLSGRPPVENARSSEHAAWSARNVEFVPHRRKVQLGTVRARCGSCGQEAELVLSEIRPQRQLGDLFKSDLDLRVDRRVTCSACESTYPGGPEVGRPRRRG